MSALDKLMSVVLILVVLDPCHPDFFLLLSHPDFVVVANIASYSGPARLPTGPAV